MRCEICLAQGHGEAEEDKHGGGNSHEDLAVHARWFGASHWGMLPNV